MVLVMVKKVKSLERNRSISREAKALVARDKARAASTIWDLTHTSLARS